MSDIIREYLSRSHVRENKINKPIEITNFNLEEMEKQTISRALQLYPNNTMFFVANQLGISERNLYLKMAKYKLLCFHARKDIIQKRRKTI